MFTRPNATFTGHDVERRSFRIALVGPQAIAHLPLVERAGYQVHTAADGLQAADLFGREELDVVVLDFELKGRPPEAILLFSHRTSPDAVMVAMVPAEEDEYFRRAFLAGARDVLPSPARGEDLLGSIDFVLEPRVLADLVDDLRGGGDFDDDEGTAPDARGTQLDMMRKELTRTRSLLDEERSRLMEESARFRQQALDAVLDRDRMRESRDRARRRLTATKAELKDRKAQLAITERACEALQDKLKETRDSERDLLSGRGDDDDAELTRMTMDPSRALPVAPGPAPTTGEVVDPVLALEQRNADAERLEQVESAQERLTNARADLKKIEEKTNAGQPVSDDEKRNLDQLKDALQREVESLEAAQREIDQQRLHIAALENTRLSLEGQVASLEREREAALSEAAMYRSVTFSDQGTDEKALMLRLEEKERELADCWTQLDELMPLKSDIESLRSQLHAERGAHLATKRALEQDKMRLQGELEETRSMQESTLERLTVLEMERSKNLERLQLISDDEDATQNV